MWHKNLPLHLMYVSTLPCKVIGVVTNMVKFHVIVNKKTRELRRKRFSLCCKHIICAHCLTHAIRWWHHCCTTRAWRYGLPSPITKQWWALCILYQKCQLNKVDRMSTSTTYFRQIVAFVLDLEWVLLKAMWNYIVFCHNSVSRNVTR